MVYAVECARTFFKPGYVLIVMIVAVMAGIDVVLVQIVCLSLGGNAYVAQRIQLGFLRTLGFVRVTLMADAAIAFRRGRAVFLQSASEFKRSLEM